MKTDETNGAAMCSVPQTRVYSKPLPTQEYLRECFDYDPETGILRWKERPLSHFEQPFYGKKLNSKMAGKEAGSRMMKKGFRTEISCNLDCEGYRIHRLIWAWVYGSIPENMEIDHRDNDPWNNRLDNLRLATPSQNKWNMGKKRWKKSPYPKGVNRTKKDREQFEARIHIPGKYLHLGYFTCPIEAGKAYEKAAAHYHGEFARMERGNDPPANC